MPHTPPTTDIIRRTLADERGQTFTEYALLVSLIAVLVIVAFPPLVSSLQGVFSAMAAGL